MSIHTKRYSVLAQDVYNINRDKRCKHGWENQKVFKKGMRFVVLRGTHTMSGGVSVEYAKLRPVGESSGAVSHSKLWYEIYPHLNICEMTIMDWMKETLPQAAYARDLIVIMEDMGVLKLENVQRAYKELEAKWDKEEQ